MPQPTSRWLDAAGVPLTAAVMAVMAVMALMALAVPAAAQSTDEAALADLERLQARSVVERDLATLESIYADDFRFVHGTGEIQTKGEWLESLRTGEARYRSRRHDVIEVELHGDVGVTYGEMRIERTLRGVESRFRVRYVRVYVRDDGRWRLVSHRTVEQTDIP